jgi:hypothetical protein
MSWRGKFVHAKEDVHGDRQADYDGDDHTGTGANPFLAAPSEDAVPASREDPFAGEHLTTPLVGWKGLGVLHDGTVGSMGFPTGARDAFMGWTPLVSNRALCRNVSHFYVMDRLERHEAPGVDCNCGWHAALRLDTAKSYSGLHDNNVISSVAQVYLWGRTVINGAGYRAQYAYPKHVYLIRLADTAADLDRIALRVYARYGVPCGVITYDDLLDWVACEQMGLGAA